MIDTENEQRIKLDEILKSLFAVSKKVLITMMNSLFKENFDVKMTEITFENNEFVSDDYDIIRGDLFLKISKGNKPYHYHIELQTKNDATMVIRMFEYGFKEAKELTKYKVDETGEIDGDDLHRILLGVANLFEYLNTKYGEDEKLNEEVHSMTKTLYDPAVEQKGIEKGREKGREEGIDKERKERIRMQYSKGLSIEYIAEINDFEVEYVKDVVKDSLQ